MNGLNGTGLGVAALMKTLPVTPAQPAQPAAPKAPADSSPFRESTHFAARPSTPRPQDSAKRVSESDSRAAVVKHENTESDKEVSVGETSQKPDPRSDTAARDPAKADAKEATADAAAADDTGENKPTEGAAVDELLAWIQQSQGELTKPAESTMVPVVAANPDLPEIAPENSPLDDVSDASSNPLDNATVTGGIDNKTIAGDMQTQNDNLTTSVVQVAAPKTAMPVNSPGDESEIGAQASENSTVVPNAIATKRISTSVEDRARISRTEDRATSSADSPVEHEHSDDDSVVSNVTRREGFQDQPNMETKSFAVQESLPKSAEAKHNNDHSPRAGAEIPSPVAPVNVASTAAVSPVLEPLIEGTVSDSSVTGVATPTAPQTPLRVTTGATTSSPATLNVNLPVTHPNWGEAMSDRVQWMVGNQLQTANIQVNPPHLGPVNVQIEMKGDEVNVVFSTHHGAVRDALESSLPKLRDVLNDSGSRTVNIDVSLQDFQQRQASQFLGQGAERQTRNRDYFQNPPDYEIQTVSAPAVGYSRNGMLDIYA